LVIGGMPPVVVPVVLVPPVVVSPPPVIVPPVEPAGMAPDMGAPSSIEHPCARAKSPSETRLAMWVNATVRCREARISTSVVARRCLQSIDDVVIRQ
jgi:hypothetical protein